MDSHVRYWNSEKERMDVNYLNSSCLGKLAPVDVLEHFNPCFNSIEKFFLQIFCGGPNFNLSILKILDEHRRDTELNPLIDISNCGLHTVHNLCKHWENGSNWNIKWKVQFLFLCNPQKSSASQACITFLLVTQKILINDIFHWLEVIPEILSFLQMCLVFEKQPLGFFNISKHLLEHRQENYMPGKCWPFKGKLQIILAASYIALFLPDSNNSFLYV